MTIKTYDIIVIGGGPSGLTAGLYAARGGMKTLLLERMGCGGQAIITDWIENYPGFPEGISGFELASKMEEQAKRFGVEIVTEEVINIEDVSRAEGGKSVKTTENIFNATAVVIASGANFKKLDVPGEAQLLGKGVSYCATCDGPFFKGKELVVVGGGDSAVQEAIFLTKFASKVTLVHRRERLRAAQTLGDKARANNKMEFKFNTIVEKINGAGSVESITLKNLTDGKTEEYKAQGIFIFVGQEPNTAFLKGALTMDAAGFLLTDENMQSSVPGIFSCGDARKKLLRQVVTACGDGALASFAAQEYVEEVKGTSYDKKPL